MPLLLTQHLILFDSDDHWLEHKLAPSMHLIFDIPSCSDLRGEPPKVLSRYKSIVR